MINISSLKNQLSAMIKRVRQGEEILIVDRDRPVARLSAVSSTVLQEDSSAFLQDLVKRGVVSPPPNKKKPSRKLLESRLVKLKSGSAVEELLKEREEAL